jgi:hypothetical protein
MLCQIASPLLSPNPLYPTELPSRARIIFIPSEQFDIFFNEKALMISISIPYVSLNPAQSQNKLLNLFGIKVSDFDVE